MARTVSLRMVATTFSAIVIMRSTRSTAIGGWAVTFLTWTRAVFMATCYLLLLQIHNTKRLGFVKRQRHGDILSLRLSGSKTKFPGDFRGDVSLQPSHNVIG